MAMSPRFKYSAFSLVEVTLAIGIITFAMVTVVALFGSLMDREREIAEKRAVMASLPGLQDYLSKVLGFEELFSLAGTGSAKTLNFVTYRSDNDGRPNPASKTTRSIWEDISFPWTGYDAARTSRWIRAEVEFDPDLNPIDTLAASGESYPHAEISLRVRFYTIPEPDATIPEDAKPALTAPLVILR